MLLLTASLLAPVHAADLEVAGIFSDHSVLQRDHAVPVWGRAGAGAEVTVEFAGQQPASATAARAADFKQARFIAPPANRAAAAAGPIFRKEFTVETHSKIATLRIVGLGDYDVSLNGRRLAATGMNQPWSQYEKTIYYRDFDLTSALVAGNNCVGVMLLNSFWHNPDAPAGRYNKQGPQRAAAEPYLLLAEIIATGKDGSVVRIGTDTSWRTTEGPITFSHVYGGEDFDARRQLPGWDRAGFDDHTWQPARETAAPTGKLERQFWPNIAAFERQTPVSVKPMAQNTFRYSFQQNIAAQLRVELAGGKAGDRVNFRCAEQTNDKDILAGIGITGCDVVTDGKPLVHQWLSYYVGMQFVEVTGAVPTGEANPQGLPVIRKLELVEVRAGLPEVGTFTSSSEIYNGTHRIIDAAMRSNMNWVMTDCPHREKLGWLECSYLLAPSFLYRYDCRAWFDKIAHDIRDAQEPSGRVPTVAPSYPSGKFTGAMDFTTEWGAAATLLPWANYEWSGDPQILRDNFDMMCRFTDFIQTEAKAGLAPGGLGDWYDYVPGQSPGASRYTPTTLSSTATWGLCALTVARAAEILNRPDDVKKYRAMHARIAEVFRREFQDPMTHKLTHKWSPQCANAMALCAELVPDANRAQLVNDIVTDLEQRGWQQTPGDIGHVYFIRALAQAGRSDVLHRVYSRDGTGSYGGILKKGLTTLPESWEARKGPSLNHCMLGHVMEWFYGYVAGIRQQPGSVGWKKILIGPNPGAQTNAEATLQTPDGRVVSRWRNDAGTFRLEAEIPEGVQAMAILPSGAHKPLRSGNQTLEEPAVQTSVKPVGGGQGYP